jgi:1-acyl-sn-glycerol-3-phosphate acyltransferase
VRAVSHRRAQCPRWEGYVGYCGCWVSQRCLLAGAVLAAALPWLGPASRECALRAWFRALLRTFRIQLTVTGGDRFGPPGAGVLVVSNQVSWLDLVALGAVQPLRMVAKSEVRAWPVIGPLARRAGTVFVDRERLSTLLRTVAAVSGALAGGAAIGAFPEGTTWCGLASGRFRPAVFQAAVDTATSVRPVALRYRLTGAGTTTVVSFVGSRSAGDRSTRSGGGGAPAAPAAADGSDRRALAAGAQAAVTAATLPLARPVPQLVAAAPALRAA